MMQRGRTISVKLLPKVHDRIVLMRQTKLRDILQNNRPVVFKGVKVMKEKEGLRTVTGWRRLRSNKSKCQVGSCVGF